MAASSDFKPASRVGAFVWLSLAIQYNWQNENAQVYASCAHVCARIITKSLLIILYYLMNLSLQFHRDFCCGDVWKTILIFKNHQFQCILHISAILLLQSLQRWIITEWLWDFLETRYQNCPSKGNEKNISSSYFVF